MKLYASTLLSVSDAFDSVACGVWHGDLDAHTGATVGLGYSHMPYIPYVCCFIFSSLDSMAAYLCTQIPVNLASFHPCTKGTPYHRSRSRIQANLLFVQFADWLEGYAKFLELNVWTSSTVVSISQDPATKIWTITIQRGNEDGTNMEERTFKVRHLVFALGWGGSTPYTPVYPGIVSTLTQLMVSL